MLDRFLATVFYVFHSKFVIIPNPLDEPNQLPTLLCHGSIEINLNIKIEQDIRVKVEREIDDLLRENEDLF